MDDPGRTLASRLKESRERHVQYYFNMGEIDGKESEYGERSEHFIEVSDG
jgi:hypothetical protein